MQRPKIRRLRPHFTNSTLRLAGPTGPQPAVPDTLGPSDMPITDRTYCVHLKAPSICGSTQRNWAGAPPSIDIPLVARAGSLHLLTTCLPAGVSRRLIVLHSKAPSTTFSAFATFEPGLRQPARCRENARTKIEYSVRPGIPPRFDSRIAPQLPSQVMPTIMAHRKPGFFSTLRI